MFAAASQLHYLICNPNHQRIRTTHMHCQILIAREKSVAHQSEGVTWHPEFGGWMIESTPSRPYVRIKSDRLPCLMKSFLGELDVWMCGLVAGFDKIPLSNLQ
jgi:hypothetical protein